MLGISTSLFSLFRVLGLDRGKQGAASQIFPFFFICASSWSFVSVDVSVHGTEDAALVAKTAPSTPPSDKLEGIAI
ncbi:hypothetical protein BJX68DRAFT_231670, partial [Aspergillus pseudodeflectus]